jgi:carbamoyltransferase
MTSRHDNIAKSLQVVTEEIIMHLLNRLHAKTRSENVCMTGGVAMNSVANGKITSQTPFKNVYIPAGAADNGTSFGAAFYVWNHLLKKPRAFVQDHAYWGCSSTNDEAIAAAKAAGVPYELLDEAALVDRTTEFRRSQQRRNVKPCRPLKKLSG